MRLLMRLRLADGPPRRRDGFDPWDFPPQQRADRLQRVAAYPRPVDGPEPGTSIPALQRLEALVAELNPEAILLLYFTPKPVTTLPVPGTPAAMWFDFCKSRYQAIASQRPFTALIDRMVEDDLTRDIENFEDTEHLRNDVAPGLERDMVAAIRTFLSAPRAQPVGR